MIEIIEIFIIAIAQGITEFLPISSSGHNAVIDHLFDLFGNPLTKDSTEFVKLNVLLHVGSLVAVLIVFRQRVIDILGKDRRLILMLIVATIPAGIVGLLIKKFAPEILTSLPLLSGCFIVTGLLLLYTLRLPEGGKTMSTVTWRDGVIIGCAQAFAILPGISRSGATIVTGLFCRLKREDAAAFSFILSIPVIAGSGLLECRDMIREAKMVQKVEQRAVEFYDVNGTFREDQKVSYEQFLQELSGKTNVEKFETWRESEKGQKMESYIRDAAEQLHAETHNRHASTLPDWLLLVGVAVSCVTGILALVFLLDWLKKGKLWYFAIWVFIMSPLTLTLALLSR